MSEDRVIRGGAFSIRHLFVILTCKSHRNEEEMWQFSQISICCNGNTNQNVAQNGGGNLKKIGAIFAKKYFANVW